MTHQKLPIVCALVTAFPLLGCTLDFNKYEQTTAVDGSPPSDTGSETGSSSGGEAGAPCGTSCLMQASQCQSSCQSTEQTCSSACQGNFCKQACTTTEQTCVQRCVRTCDTCFTTAGCSSNSECASVTD